MVFNQAEMSLMSVFFTSFVNSVIYGVSGSERSVKIDGLINRLESERTKISPFKTELPFCMSLVDQAIASLKKMQLDNPKPEPVIEFIPLKSSSDEEDDDVISVNDDNGESRNWLQLGTINADHGNANSIINQNQKPETEVRKRGEQQNGLVISDPYQSSRTPGSAFISFKGYGGFPVGSSVNGAREELPISGLPVINPVIKNPLDEMRCPGLIAKFGSSIAGSPSSPSVQSSLLAESQPRPEPTSRKQRRCWSPDLHRRFVAALEHLGGTQVATPKKIRELMKVDGLTNDEVKSHLQKFRLHARKQSPANCHSGSPDGPLQLAEEDANSWKSHVSHPGIHDV